ncbi:3-deoxy-D-manno-octulosonic acid transferase [Yoonia maritima]|uniref:3-deoxy-D-manno-octulosonic acid transferase n=1 Tax=Yoonia maritima TaxID=1435347 RepID=UPI000D0E5A97|nr:glycosyltransferase N-terminal domain-containing protein [Yoonia maritima]
MTPKASMQRGLVLRLYLGVSHLIPAVAGRVLRKRLARGKEHPTRWPEKQAQSLAPRPDGTLIWLHAVGLGEVLSLRGLIARMADEQPEASFLVTSTTHASADVFAKNLPPHTFHQFLPLDAPRYRQRFLDHFRPDLCIWAEQDIWPGFVSDINRRGIPQTVIAARMGGKSYAAHKKVKGLYRNLYQAMALVTAQDQTTADHLTKLGARPTISGSLKPAAPALSYDGDELAALRAHLAGRFIWAVAPSHPEDEQIAIRANELVRHSHPDALLVIVPRFPNRRNEFAENAPRKSLSKLPTQTDSLWICDTFGELGLVYRLARAALIGGTFSDVGGHNPWEAAALNTAIFHGPQVDNFVNDYDQLDTAKAAFMVSAPQNLADHLCNDDLINQAMRAADCVQTASHQTDLLANDLLRLLDATHE